MDKVVFTTKGLLDFQSLLVFGMSSKPNTANPIGFFGTGLKYAIAVLMRHNIPVTVWIGTDEYEFYTKEVDFRSRVYKKIVCRRRNSLVKRWKYTTLPFTTELGQTWKLWEVFRELHANTLDEGGETTIVSEEQVGIKGHTKIVVGGDFALTYKEKDEIFLPEGKNIFEDGRTVQIIARPSRFLYYRSLRVFELPKHSFFTYNILTPITLTENRTLAYQFEARDTIARAIMSEAESQTIHNVLHAGNAFWEDSFSYESVYSPRVSSAWLEALKTRITSGRYVNSGALKYWSRHTTSISKPTSTDSLAEQLEWWIGSGELVGHNGLIKLLTDVLPIVRAYEGSDTNDEPIEETS